ncbi:MAG: hypothetical protein LBP59_15315 [Planctomycetaceae bacterium]|jgi:hypothetical protein|nr:hypothetical protein [Planctomycetaceae bacterium]
MRTLILLTIFLFPFTFASAAEDDVFLQDEIALRKKALEFAEADLQNNNTAPIRSKNNEGENIKKYINLATAKINLYQTTGEKDKLYNALKDKLEWSKKLYQLIKKEFDADNKIGLRYVRQGELLAYEAELELDNAEQKKPENEIALLKKKLEFAEKNVKESDDSLLHNPAMKTNNITNAREHLELAKAKIALYRTTDDKDKLINALNEQLEWTKKIRRLNEIALGENTNKALTRSLKKTYMFSNLAVYEAEVELKNAKQEKPDKNDNINLLKKRLEVAEKNMKISNDALTSGTDNIAAMNAFEHIFLADKKKTLYQATEENDKLINAIEEKIEWAKKLQSIQKNINETKKHPAIIQNGLDEVIIMEAELELKKAKQKKL